MEPTRKNQGKGLRRKDKNWLLNDRREGWKKGRRDDRAPCCTHPRTKAARVHGRRMVGRMFDFVSKRPARCECEHQHDRSHYQKGDRLERDARHQDLREIRV